MMRNNQRGVTQLIIYYAPLVQWFSIEVLHTFDSGSNPLGSTTWAISVNGSTASLIDFASIKFESNIAPLLSISYQYDEQRVRQTKVYYAYNAEMQEDNRDLGIAVEYTLDSYNGIPFDIHPILWYSGYIEMLYHRIGD